MSIKRINELFSKQKKPARKDTAGNFASSQKQNAAREKVASLRSQLLRPNNNVNPETSFLGDINYQNATTDVEKVFGVQLTTNIDRAFKTSRALNRDNITDEDKAQVRTSLGHLETRIKNKAPSSSQDDLTALRMEYVRLNSLLGDTPISNNTDSSFTTSQLNRIQTQKEEAILNEDFERIKSLRIQEAVIRGIQDPQNTIEDHVKLAELYNGIDDAVRNEDLDSIALSRREIILQRHKVNPSENLATQLRLADLESQMDHAVASNDKAKISKLRVEILSTKAELGIY